MNKVLYILFTSLFLCSCFKDKNCNRIPDGIYKATFFQKNGYNFSEQITIENSSNSFLKINNSTINKSNCTVEGYYSVGYQSSIKINGEIKKIKRKKYKIEGNYHRKYTYNGNFFEYEDKFIITNE